jgi:hypothetical protein
MQAVVIKEDRREKPISAVWVEGESEFELGTKPRRAALGAT